MSLELVEKSLSEIKGEIALLQRNQLLMFKTLVRLMFNDNIPMELVKPISDLEQRIKSYELKVQKAQLSIEKSPEKP